MDVNEQRRGLASEPLRRQQVELQLLITHGLVNNVGRVLELGKPRRHPVRQFRRGHLGFVLALLARFPCIRLLGNGKACEKGEHEQSDWLHRW